jgi:hypothetical protein
MLVLLFFIDALYIETGIDLITLPSFWFLFVPLPCQARYSLLILDRIEDDLENFRIIENTEVIMRPLVTVKRT